MRPCGGQIFSTCRNSSSTGVARPKIVTITRSVLRSLIDLVHLAGEVRERPVDDAHRLVLLERELRTRRAQPSRPGGTESSSLHPRVSGTGSSPPPTKPVTRGVFLDVVPQLRRSFPSRPARNPGYSRRLLVTFLPLRSLHDFFGRESGSGPILSANPKASARVRSDSATLFSKPE